MDDGHWLMLLEVRSTFLEKNNELYVSSLMSPGIHILSTKISKGMKVAGDLERAEDIGGMIIISSKAHE